MRSTRSSADLARDRLRHPPSCRTPPAPRSRRGPDVPAAPVGCGPYPREPSAAGPGPRAAGRGGDVPQPGRKASQEPLQLPSQVSPPQVAVSDVAPSAVVGADVVALPVLAGVRRRRTGPGARCRRAARRARRRPVRPARRGRRHRRGRRGRRARRAGHLRSDQHGPAPGAAGRRRRGHPRRAPPGRRRPGPATRAARPSPPRSARSATTPGCAPWSRAWCSGPSSFHWRSEGPLRQPVGRVVLAGLVDAEVPHAARSPGRSRWPARAGARGPSRWCPRT